jgi:hypothetical protein
MRRAALIFLGGLLLAVEVSAITGNGWKKWPIQARDGYVAGVIDAWDNIEDIHLYEKQQATDFLHHSLNA